MHLVHSDKWTGMGQKLEMIASYLGHLAHESASTGVRWIVMLIDGYDVLFQLDVNEIIRRFVASGRKIIISSESGCFPWDNTLCSLNIKPCHLFEQGDRSWPNSGGIIGDANALLEVMKVIQRLPRDMVVHWPGTDQGLMGQLYLTHRFRDFEIDRSSEFFASFGPPLLRKPDNWSWTAGGLHTTQAERLSKPAPAVLHFPGGGGSECYHTVEAAAWYNRQRPPGFQTGSGDCPRDRQVPTFVYEYDRNTQNINAPKEVLGFYEGRCRDFHCDCTRCECSAADSQPLFKCAEHELVGRITGESN